MEKHSQKLAKGAYNFGRNLVQAKFTFFTLKFKIISGVVVSALAILLLIVVGVISGLSTAIVGSTLPKTSPIIKQQFIEISPMVERYRDDIILELKKHNREEYVEILLAIMQQESGGYGNDPMQASESKCGRIGCITSASESIKYGVRHFLKVMDLSNGDLQLTLQSYNFGTGFLSYVNKNGGRFSYDLVTSYSQMMYEKLQHTGIYRCKTPEALSLNACYGDIFYIENVMKYMGGPGSYLQTTPLNMFNLRVTSPFGYRTLDRGLEHHNGVDYSCKKGEDKIYAVQKGEVIFGGQYSGAASYGNFVTIKHHKTFYTTYAHLDSVLVEPNQHIEAGTVIGYCGNTGRSFGAHLHFEMKTQLWSGHYDPSPHVNEYVERMMAISREDDTLVE